MLSPGYINSEEDQRISGTMEMPYVASQSDVYRNTKSILNNTRKLSGANKKEESTSLLEETKQTVTGSLVIGDDDHDMPTSH